MTKRILIADTDDDLLTRLEVLFEDKGYETVTAWGGKEAVQYLGSGSFDFVLLSDYLPDVPGEQVWNALAHQPASASVALLKTERPVSEAENRYRQLGGRCVLSKASAYKIVEDVHACLSSGERSPLRSRSGPKARAANGNQVASGE